MSNIIVQGNEINAKEYVEKITIEGIGEEKTLNPRLIVAKGGSMINYSTEEQVIGTWIDGKPLYQRTWRFEYSDTETVGSSAHQRQLRITKCIDNTCVIRNIEAALNTNSYGVLPLGCAKTFNADSTAQSISFNMFWSNFLFDFASVEYTEFNEVYITLKYTKTTD